MAHRSIRAAAAVLALSLAAAAPAMAQQAASPEAQAEQRIASFKSQLRITPAEEAPWSGFTDVMRQNAAELGAKMAERSNGIGRMNAVDDLKSYAAITSLRAQEISRLATSFETLYAALSPAQKAEADRLFRNVGTHGGATHG